MTISITYPGGGAIYTPGSVVNVGWTYTGIIYGATVWIEGNSNEGTHWEINKIIDGATINSGGTQIAIPIDGLDRVGTARIGINVLSWSGPLNSGLSYGAWFQIVGGGSVILDYPEGGESFSQGTVINVEWSTSGDVGPVAKFTLINDTKITDLGQFSTSAKSAQVSLPDDALGDYTLEIECSGTSFVTVSDVSGSFTIGGEPPKNLRASGLDKSILLYWDKPSDSSINEIDSYNIYRNSTSDNDLFDLVGSSSTLSFKDTGLVNDVTYKYYVTAVCSNAPESGPSNVASATPEEPPLVKVLSPNGDEAWLINPEAPPYHKYDITWEGKFDDEDKVTVQVISVDNREKGLPYIVTEWKDVPAKSGKIQDYMVPDLPLEMLMGIESNDNKPGRFVVRVSLDTVNYDESDNPFWIGKHWTVMGYLDGDEPAMSIPEAPNIDPYVLNQFNVLMGMNSDQCVNFVAKLDGMSYSPYRGYLDGADSKEFPDGDTEPNMGAQGTLQDFLTWSMGEFLSEKYVLIISSHGSGLYMCSDASAGMDHLDLSELRAAMAKAEQDSQKSIGLTVLDACYMATLETAYELQTVTNLIVASETVVPVDGLPIRVLGYVHEESDIAAETIGASMVSEFEAAYAGRNCQLSLISTSGVYALDQAVNLLALATVDEIKTFADYQWVQGRRYASQSFDIDHEDSTLVDLFSLAATLSGAGTPRAELTELANNVRGLAGSVVLKCYKDSSYSSSVKSSNGLSICFPTLMDSKYVGDGYFDLRQESFHGSTFAKQSAWYSDSGLVWYYHYDRQRASAPRDLKAIPIQGGFKLSWNLPEYRGLGIEYFLRYDITVRSPQQTYVIEVPAGSVSLTDATVTDLDDGTQYEISMEQINSAPHIAVSSLGVVQGWSAKTSCKPGTSTDVQNLEGTSDEDGVRLNWNSPDSDGGSSVTSYNVYRGSESTGASNLRFYTITPLNSMAFIKVASVTNTTYLDFDVTNGTTYHYRIYAVNANGESLMASDVNVTALFTPASNSDLIELLSNPFLIGGIAAVIMIAAISIIMVRRRKKK